jgi:hypothetical protein
MSIIMEDFQSSSTRSLRKLSGPRRTRCNKETAIKQGGGGDVFRVQGSMATRKFESGLVSSISDHHVTATFPSRGPATPPAVSNPGLNPLHPPPAPGRTLQAREKIRNFRAHRIWHRLRPSPWRRTQLQCPFIQSRLT